MKRVRIVISSFFLFLLIHCHDSTELKECDPEKGRFIRGQHYIPSKFLNEEKRLDYKKLHKQLKERSKFHPNCIPIEKSKSLAEIIEEEEEVADISR